VWNKARHVSVYWTDQPRQAMKSKGSLLLTLLLFMGLAPGSALPQSTMGTVAGRVVGLRNDNAANFQVALASDHAPCSFLQTRTTADGSFRFSSVRAGDYRVAVSGLPEGYGIKTMTAGVVDLLSHSVRLVASSQTQVLIEVARIEDIRRGKSAVVHVGDGLRSSCLIRQVKPVYPSQAKAAHIVGNVILEVRTDRNGYVEDVTVVQGHPSLIQSAIDAVRQWRYVPVVLRGETVPVVTTVVVPFGSK
jgi:TonB family protein